MVAYGGRTSPAKKQQTKRHLVDQFRNVTLSPKPRPLTDTDTDIDTESETQTVTETETET